MSSSSSVAKLYEMDPPTRSNGASSLHLVNKLSESRSPYVRGHMNNPVAWQNWGPDALDLAKRYNRLLFISIGYAACHWCHVMERESFESLEVARILNDYFIPIKIDREERPDVDAIYMNYVQATTGSGGWPLNVFVTPDLEPVFGGTYWPGPNNSMTAIGTAVTERVGFLGILEKMKDVWTMQESRCRESAKEITRQLKQFAEEGVHSHNHQTGDDGGTEGLEIELLEEAYQHFAKKFDKVNGGFSNAPKFPTPSNLSLLLRLGQWPQAVQGVVGEDECKEAAAMVLHTLRNMARGGIRDQIGHGFARYSVTKDWSLPHFEKMLYDQPQLLDVYLDAFLITRDPEILGVAYDITAYLTSEPMAAPNGGFFSSEDADSLPSPKDTEKREGAYYVWTLKEFHDILGDKDGDICARFYGVLADGNVAPANDPHDEFISQNVLKVTTNPGALAKELGISEASIADVLTSGRQKLRQHRDEHRPRPALDDKIVVSWNGLAIGALACTSAVLSSIDPTKASECLNAATSAAAFIKRELWDPESKTLYRVYREGRGSTTGLCDDYAFLIHGLIDLYEATFDDAHLEFADTLQRRQIELFTSPDSAGFYTTPSPHPPDLLMRLKSGMDNAEPSSNNISARNLYRLSALLEDPSYFKAAGETVGAFEAEVEQFPYCFAGMLGSVVMGRLGLKAIVLTGDSEEALKKLRQQVRPNVVVTSLSGGKGKWLRERNPLLRELDGEKNGVMICEGGACREGVEYL
ncbi:hypothetical protein ACLMJK_002107 [Lecanora helva]